MRRLLIICIFLAAASPAAAAPFAYVATGSGDFGLLDLGSGTFVHCGYPGTYLSGLAALENGPLYGINDAWFFRVDPHTGVLTKIAPAGNYLVALGSTEHTIYVADSIANLYTIDPQSGAETAVGKGVPGTDFILALSGGGRTLYEMTPLGLYDYIPRQGMAHRKSRQSTFSWVGLAMIDGVLYGLGQPEGGGSAQYVYTISTLDGTATAIATAPIGIGITAFAPAPPGNTGACRADQ